MKGKDMREKRELSVLEKKLKRSRFRYLFAFYCSLIIAGAGIIATPFLPEVPETNKFTLFSAIWAMEALFILIIIAAFKIRYHSLCEKTGRIYLKN